MIFFFLRDEETIIPKFTEYLNKDCMGLFFTVTHSNLNSSVDTDRVKANTFRKSNASNTILHTNSHYPKHIIKNIPVGEMLRANQNCSLEKEFDNLLLIFPID